jgi:hypothetical protein
LATSSTLAVTTSPRLTPAPSALCAPLVGCASTATRQPTLTSAHRSSTHAVTKAGRPAWSRYPYLGELTRVSRASIRGVRERAPSEHALFILATHRCTGLRIEDRATCASKTEENDCKDSAGCTWNPTIFAVVSHCEGVEPAYEVECRNMLDPGTCQKNINDGKCKSAIDVVSWRGDSPFVREVDTRNVTVETEACSDQGRYMPCRALNRAPSSICETLKKEDECSARKNECLWNEDEPCKCDLNHYGKGACKLLAVLLSVSNVLRLTFRFVLRHRLCWFTGCCQSLPRMRLVTREWQRRLLQRICHLVLVGSQGRALEHAGGIPR